MVGYGILMIVFGFFVIMAGLYLVKNSKGDFSSVLLWKSNVQKMSVSEIKYAGKVSMSVGLAPIISGIVALFYSNDSIIPIIVLAILLIALLLLSMKIFK